MGGSVEETANEGAGKLIIHKRVDGDLFPVSTVQPVAPRMVTASEVYMAVSPASVSTPMEERSVRGIRVPRGPKVEAMEDLIWPYEC